MNRRELLQNLIDQYYYQNYIEIGVHKGKTFLPLICRNKIAVDPSFRISPGFLMKSYLKNRSNLGNRYFQITSEKFFKRKLPTFKEERYPDLVFIDGLHTFEASLNDVLNSLKFLKEGGYVVLHDCFPPNKAAATPAKSLLDAKKMNIPGWTGAWCGDVWKTVLFLKTKYKNELEISVYNTDLGLATIRLKGSRLDNQKIDTVLFDKIDKLGFEDLIKDPKNIINLKEIDRIKEILPYTTFNEKLS